MLYKNYIPNISNDDISYIMFTSGSTGHPKGVPISYKNVSTFLNYCQNIYNINNNDRVSHTFELTFDLSIFDIFMTLAHGATLVVIKNLELLSPVAAIINKNLSVWFSVPSVAKLAQRKQLLKNDILSNLRLTLFCGEPLPVDLVTDWARSASNSKIINLYGPTELTIACSYYEYSKINSVNFISHIVPIGNIFEHLTFIIVDENLTPIKNNESGQLAISGDQMFQGYISDEAKTLEAFINIDGIKYYLTGDIVKVVNGVLHYIGRLDSQLKINGYRIETVEIESIAKKIEGIHDVIVIDYFDNNEDRKLAIFYTSDKQIAHQYISEVLNNKLPKYMIPNTFIELQNMPLNINGKIDKNKLRLMLKD
jgi:non-ribosomal peptide synthetase component F